ncbi:MAG: hypothetical protein IIW63_08100 [Clostridia bacterium]|nr:hypothetical protein [Clostridia bacterium]
MDKRKLAAYVIGGTFCLLLLCGAVLPFLPKAVTITTAIAIVCLCLASGMLIPNPVSTVWLIMGICMLAIPKASGIIFICIGITGSIINVITSKKTLKLW